MLNQDEFIVVRIEDSEVRGAGCKLKVRWADGTATSEPRSYVEYSELIREFQLKKGRERSAARRKAAREVLCFLN